MITPREAAVDPDRATTAIDGVLLTVLRPHADDRGVFTELFRQSWDTRVDPVQWNLVTTERGVLRGVHLHHRHTDYLTVVRGTATIGLKDLRPGSRTVDATATFDLDGDSLQALTIPPGVAHGFCFTQDATHVYAVSHEWDHADELGCRFDDPGLELTWPIAPRVSERDAELGSLDDLRAAYRRVLARTDSD